MFGQIRWGGIPALPASFPRGNVPRLQGSGREATARARPRAQRPKGDDGQDPVLRLRVSPAVTGETDRPLPPVLRPPATATAVVVTLLLPQIYPPPRSSCPSGDGDSDGSTVNFHLLPPRLAPLLFHLDIGFYLHQEGPNLASAL
ncbi:hypothetical protein CFC21_084035 [Triticum aestivum]|uniref:Uncharacterized protein n=3 Tax=Triticum TaxID=4564 RepID=A0A9R0Y3T0_TRITD|nr:hypothetical protein CFC21_084035 [Triticum aestivum]VAI48139.1 unnamed protein product [Triticum turgidum subsp. durum]